MAAKKLIDLLVITHNRLGLTRQTFAALLDTDLGIPWTDIQLTVVDNCSKPQTIQYLKELQKKRPDRIHRILFNKRNDGVVPTMARFFSACKAPYVAKLDNDIVVQRKHFIFLMQALKVFPNLRIAGACIRPTQNPLKVKGYKVEVKEGIRVAYARNVGGIFLSPRSLFEVDGVPAGDKLYGWTGYQHSLVAKYRSKKKDPVGFVTNCAITHLDVRREQNKPISTYDLWEK